MSTQAGNSNLQWVRALSNSQSSLQFRMGVDGSDFAPMELSQLFSVLTELWGNAQ